MSLWKAALICEIETADMLTVVAFMNVSFGTCGIRTLTQSVLLEGKL